LALAFGSGRIPNGKVGYPLQWIFPKSILKDHDALAQMSKIETWGKSFKQDEAMLRFLGKLNYIAYLINNDRLDRRYVTDQIKCDISRTSKRFTAEQKDDWVQVDVSEMKRFGEAGLSCIGEGRDDSKIISEEETFAPLSSQKPAKR
jgi:hypothetical protein